MRTRILILLCAMLAGPVSAQMVRGGISGTKALPLSGGSLSSVGRLVTSSLTPTVTATGYGATGSVGVEVGSTDLAGIATLTVAGAGPAATGTLVITFSAATAYGTNTPVVLATLMSGTGAWNARATAIVTAASPTSATITWDNNAVALVAGSTWKIAYMVIGK